jgi:hypothetical protein
MTSPDVLRAAFLFETSYVFLFFGSAALVAARGFGFCAGSRYARS